MIFFSNNDWYKVIYTDPLKEQAIRDYINTVESLLPSLEAAFGLRPSHRQFIVEFKKEFGRPKYLGEARIKMKENIDLTDPQRIYGGVFYETVHGFLENYGYCRGNLISESCVIILQVDALKKIEGNQEARKWAKKYFGMGNNENVDPFRKDFWRIYKEYGFEPFRAVYKEMGVCPHPIIQRISLGLDWNSVWQRLGYPCRFDV
jgi:hypothetical protein